MPQILADDKFKLGVPRSLRLFRKARILHSCQMDGHPAHELSAFVLSGD
jgi:hypothetical protein